MYHAVANTCTYTYTTGNLFFAVSSGMCYTSICSFIHSRASSSVLGARYPTEGDIDIQSAYAASAAVHRGSHCHELSADVERAQTNTRVPGAGLLW